MPSYPGVNRGGVEERGFDDHPVGSTCCGVRMQLPPLEDPWAEDQGHVLVTVLSVLINLDRDRESGAAIQSW